MMMGFGPAEVFARLLRLSTKSGIGLMSLAIMVEGWHTL